MKLYDLARNTKFYFNVTGGTYLFHHVDGMYSYCTDDDGNVYHFAAWTEVEPIE